MATAQTIKLLRNTTVSADKTTALAALQTKLASMPIGEPAVNLYTVSGTTKEVLLGISAGDGNYSIYEPATEISQEIISKINELDSTKESNPSNNITITVTQEDGKIKDVVLNVPSGDTIALQSDIAVSGDYVEVTDYPEVEGVVFTPVNAGDNLDTAFKSVDQNVATLANEVIKNEEVTTASFVKVREALELSDGLGYESNTGSNYISGATSFADADNKLDSAIKTISDSLNGITGNNPITITDSGGTKVISLTFDGVTLIVKDGKLCVNTLDCGVYQ